MASFPTPPANYRELFQDALSWFMYLGIFCGMVALIILFPRDFKGSDFKESGTNGKDKCG